MKSYNKKAIAKSELLAVMAVVVFMVCVIIPAFARVGNHARRVACRFQLATLGQLVTTYANNNDGNLLPFSLGFKNDKGANYYTYFSTKHVSSIAGATGLGVLYLEELIDPENDLVFCPEMNNLFGGSLAVLGTWNPRGDSTHWNYIGSDPDADNKLKVEDYWIGWLPMRLSYGFRISSTAPVSTLAQLGGKSYLSDIWAAQQGTYWATRRSHIPHKEDGKVYLNAWYGDGHVSSNEIKDEFFEGAEPDSLLKDDITWSVLFDGESYPEN